MEQVPDDFRAYKSHMFYFSIESGGCFCFSLPNLGFVCSAGSGMAHIFEKTEEKEVFRKTKEIKVPVDQNSTDPSNMLHQVIACIALSPSEETLIATTKSNQLYSLPLSSTDLGKVIF